MAQAQMERDQSSSLLSLQQSLGSGISCPSQLRAILGDVEQVCTGIASYAAEGGSLSSDELLQALDAVSRVLADVQDASGSLGFVTSAGGGGGGTWAGAVLELADTCLHRSYSLLQPAVDGGSAFPSVQATANRLLKDGVLPLLCTAAGEQTAATGFCLASQFQGVLRAARTAADLVGLRAEGRAEADVLASRSYAVLNTLWVGVSKLWLAVPPDARAQLAQHGLGVEELLGTLCSYLEQDLAMCTARLDPNCGKLLLFWLSHASRLVVAYPEAAPSVWQRVLRWAVQVRLAGEQLEATPDPRAAAVLGGGRGEAVLEKAVRLLVHCANLMPEGGDQLRVALDSLRMQLGEASSPTKRQRALAALRLALELLAAAPAMRPVVRARAVALIDSVFSCLRLAGYSAAVTCGTLRQQAADSLFLFFTACSHAACGGAGEASAADAALEQDTWVRCQQQLFLLALQPHPVVADVQGNLWSGLAATSDPGLLRQHITGLHEILKATLAAEVAAAASYAPPPPTAAHVVGLLACLLSTAPAGVTASYFQNFLKVLPTSQDDCCYLATLSVELQLATLVDSAAAAAAAAAAQPSPPPSNAASVVAALQHLSSLLVDYSGGLLQQLRGGEQPGAEALLYLAWLLRCLQCGTAYLLATATGQGQEGLAKSMAGCVLDLLLAAPPAALPCFALPALGSLCNLQEAGTGALDPAQLAALLPVLLACQKREPLAAAATRLAAAYTHCEVPHAQLFHTALAQAEPLLHHAAMEAYAGYVRGCPAPNVRSALPPCVLDPATSATAEGFQDIMRQYISRSATPDFFGPGDSELADWSAALHDSACRAPAQLRRALDSCRARAAAAAAAAAAPAQQAPVPAAAAAPADGVGDGRQPPSGGGGSGCGESAVDEAVGAVAEAVRALERALRRAGGTSGLDAGARKLLQQCAVKLGHACNASEM